MLCALLICLCVYDLTKGEWRRRQTSYPRSTSENGTNRTVVTLAGSASLDLGVKLSRGLQNVDVNL